MSLSTLFVKLKYALVNCVFQVLYPVILIYAMYIYYYRGAGGRHRDAVFHFKVHELNIVSVVQDSKIMVALLIYL